MLQKRSNFYYICFFQENDFEIVNDDNIQKKSSLF